MKGVRLRQVLCYTLILPAALTISSSLFLKTCHALTASYGEPYNGNLVNGVVFPNMFPGYHVRDYERAYTTPELAGALLDAIEAVRTQFPGTCDVFIGDFSKNGGGRFGGHLSHQNGRDVDVGLYARDNSPLHNLIPMNGNNLDPAKTLFMIENLAASQRVQYIFLDRSIQKVLYDYGIAHGCTQAYLNRLFGGVPGALVQDIPGHVSHMHIRFFTPWSTLASHIGGEEANMRSIIAVAQASYLPKKVDYYVTGKENGIPQLAKSFGVSETELCAWNRLAPSSVLVPGSCLVFYKRSFESGPVLLANSLQPGYIAQAAAPPVRVASAQPQGAPQVLSDSIDVDQAATLAAPRPSGEPAHFHHAREKGREEGRVRKAAVYYTVKHGGTLKDIARQTGIPLNLLARLNGLSANSRLHRGAKITLADATVTPTARNLSRGRHSSSPICFAAESGKNGMTAAYYRVTHGGTLKDVAMKTGIPLASLCRLNRLHQSAKLKRGQMIKLAQADLPVRPSLGGSSCAIKFKHQTRKSSAVKSHGKAVKSTRAETTRKQVVAKKTPRPHHATASKPTSASRAASSKASVKTGHRAAGRPAKFDHKQALHSKAKTKSATTRRRTCSKLARR